jgi:ribulose-phosphate 3-epimerase
LVKLAPSILSADFSALLSDVLEVQEAGAEYLHIDVMDGHFVPNITVGPLVVKALRPKVKLCLDAHLMIESPDRYISDFIDAGADLITDFLKNIKMHICHFFVCGHFPAFLVNYI